MKIMKVSTMKIWSHIVSTGKVASFSLLVSWSNEME